MSLSRVAKHNSISCVMRCAKRGVQFTLCKQKQEMQKAGYNSSTREVADVVEPTQCSSKF